MLIGVQEVIERLRHDARNSSHSVWPMAGLSFFRTSNEWVFGFTQRVGVTLLALEPLIPGAPVTYTSEHAEAFRTAWAEFQAEVKPRITAFVAVYSDFLPFLTHEGFESLKVGQEPWIILDDCIPRGNAAKGVRAARNQALRAGLWVEEWAAANIAADPQKRKVLGEILNQWRATRLVELAGFLNAVDPFAYMTERRYFVVCSAKRVEAFLVASPIAGIKSYFLEDLVHRRWTPNGASELLTLEAMITLGEKGAKQASLGVISMKNLGGDPTDSIVAPLKRALVVVSRLCRLFYNTQGLEIYRRRFKPQIWSKVHLAVKKEKTTASTTITWIRVVCALIVAFAPRVRPSGEWLKQVVSRLFKRYGLTLSIASIGIIFMAFINHFENIPHWAVQKYAFYGNAPLGQWFYRSLVSDFLYFDRMHFLLCHGLFVLLMGWAERTHRRQFLVPFIFLSGLLDDIINYVVITKPFAFFQPDIFRHLVAYKDVGSSLLVTTLLGLQMHQFRRWREPVFAILCLSIVMMFLFPQPRLDHFALDLNHLLFFVVGYLAGTIKQEYERAKSRLTSRLKPPPREKCGEESGLSESRKIRRGEPKAEPSRLVYSNPGDCFAPLAATELQRVRFAIGQAGFDVFFI